MNFQPNRIVLKSLLLIELLFILNVHSFSQPRSQDFLDTKINFQFEKTYLINIFQSISRDYNIAILLEVAASGNNKGTDFNSISKEITINENTLRGLLDSIIRQIPDYKWEITDGVIDFVPVAKRDPFIEKLFNTPIKSFSLNGYRSLPEIDEKLATIPEVVDLLNLNEMEVNKFYSVSGFGGIPPKDDVDLSLSNTNFKELLHNIVKKSRYKFRFVRINIHEFEGINVKSLFL